LTAEAGQGHRHAPLLSILSSFLKVGLTSFGGGTSAWMHREVVERHQWLTEQQFLASLTVAQVLPGPNPVNMAVYLGLQLRGGLGALVAATGMIVPSFCMILILGLLYGYLSSFPATSMVLSGFAMVGVGATLVMGTKGARQFIRHPIPVLIALSTFVVVGLLRWPLVPVVLVAVPFSVVLSFYWRRGPTRAG
jgi:chromate transporter